MLRLGLSGALDVFAFKARSVRLRLLRSLSPRDSALLVVSLALAAAALTFAQFGPRPPQAPAALTSPPHAPDQPDQADAAVSGEGARPADKWAQGLPEAQLPLSTVTLRPRFDVVDARTFGSDELTVALENVVGPRRDAVCFDRNGFRWACGLQARAALANLIRSESLTCAGRIGATRPVEARCRLSNGDDLAQTLVRAGWVRPAEGHQGSEALETARKAERGLWNGGWSEAQ